MQSYAKRTVIEGFDPMFNAITGLNGSGKSNILDSICFVLGISRLEQVAVLVIHRTDSKMCGFYQGPWHLKKKWMFS
jgi:recombinational DNA repair ATPase RecF